ncbi:hypothetical protein THAOC_04615 [Thalassiosira oceanica]|uniref:Uncharacterized protein n=1 Tax=Thalassiosira oceanica TaxID=159749 RepID=K0T9J7_THAOC|nr:hypothetical protein THAOC_04615 [Thalassiosira oceanica]|eukprot:EJK73744.1 hypothetical protein THAOC_04615 [Thalassiosira oceanica]
MTPSSATGGASYEGQAEATRSAAVSFWMCTPVQLSFGHSFRAAGLIGDAALSLTSTAAGTSSSGHACQPGRIGAQGDDGTRQHALPTRRSRRDCTADDPWNAITEIHSCLV